MSKVIKPLIIVAAIAVNVIPVFGQIASLSMIGLTGAATAISTITAMGIAAGLSMVQDALAPNPKIALSQLERLNASVDPSTGRKAVFGKRVAMATDIRYTEPWGDDQDYIDYIVAVAAHKVSAVHEIWLDDKKAWTSAGGVQGDYVDYLWVDTRLEGTAANTIAINGGGKWGSTRRLTGCAYVHIRIKRTGNGKKAESPFSGGLTSRMTIIGDGMPVYDPRFDSTVPGGSGSQRANNCATWQFSAGGLDQGANPVLQALAYQLGWKINGKASVGVGTPHTRLNMLDYQTAANECDETVTTSTGTQKRYVAQGVFSESDGPQTVLGALMTSCNGALRDTGGKLGIRVRINDLAVVAVDLTEDDILAAGTWEPYAEIGEAFNVVRGRYCDPSDKALYQLVDYPEIRLTSDDGQDRILTLDLPLTDNAARAQRIAKQVLQRLQYRGKFTTTFNHRAWKAKQGDIVRVTLAAAGWSQKLFRVESQTPGRVDGACPMVLREESTAIYQWDADDQAPVSPISPTTYDPLNNPYVQGIREAMSLIEEIVDDDLLGPAEKPRVVQEYSILVAEQAGIDALATSLGITTEKTAYDGAMTALIGYLTGLSPAYNDYSQNTAIVRSTFISRFQTAYIKRQDLLNAINQVSFDQGTAAMLLLTNIASDSLLTPDEKPQIIRENSVITTEQSGIDAQATAYGITTEKTAYDNAVSTLTSYLSGLTTPVAWNNLTGNTTIVGTTFRTRFNTVYTTRQALLTKIAQVAGTLANWAGVASRPVELTDGRITAGLNSDGTIKTGRVSTSAVVDNSLTKTFAKDSAVTLTGSGAYAWQDLITDTVNMTVAGELLLWGDIQNAYGGGALPMSWQIRFLVDGVQIGNPKGGAGYGTDVAGIMRIATGLAAGNRTVKLQWRADTTNLSCPDGTMFGMGRFNK